jgi:hypothetical protein
MINYNLILIPCLLIFISISKEFLVLNEEILVLLSYFIFIFLTIHFCKSLINDFLNSKINSIKNEFYFYIDLQKKTVFHLISYYKKRMFLSGSLIKILLFAKNEIKILFVYFKNFWFNLIKISFEEKIKKLIIFNVEKYLSVQVFFLVNLIVFFSRKIFFRLL